MAALDSATSYQEEFGVAMATDPVCGMRVDPDDAAATVEHDGVSFYFCSQACSDAFAANPTSYVSEPERG